MKNIDLHKWAAGAVVGIALTVPWAAAEAAVLAAIKADVTGDTGQETVELTGEKRIPGSNYYERLMVVVKNERGHMVTAWKPDIEGGYYCLLEKIPAREEETPQNPSEKQAKKAEEHGETAGSEAGTEHEEAARLLEDILPEIAGQGSKEAAIMHRPYDTVLLLAGRGGTSAAVESRILDFSDGKKVREAFSGADNLGITASARYLPGREFTVRCILPGTERQAKQELEFTGKAASVFGLYAEDGSIAKPHLKPAVTGIVSLAWQSGRLFTLQDVLAADRRTVLGRLAARWEKTGERWQPVEVRLLDGTERPEEDASADQPAAAGNWQLYPRSVWIGERIISRPTVAVEEKPEIQNRINEVLEAAFRRAPGEEERAYQVKFAGPGLLSLELGRRDQKGNVIREWLNFNMKTGKTVSLQEMFRTEDKDFLKVLNLVGKEKDTFVNVKPVFWHYDGSQFIFQDRLLDAAFQEEEKIRMAVVDKNDLKKFLKQPELLDQ